MRSHYDCHYRSRRNTFNQVGANRTFHDTGSCSEKQSDRPALHMQKMRRRPKAVLAVCPKEKAP